MTRFWEKYPKHKQKYDMIQAIEEFADVRYWHKEGKLSKIIKKLKFNPDFIIHYDIEWGYKYAPKIKGMNKINIPKGCFVLDLHYSIQQRTKYIEKNNMDLIFSVTKKPFLKTFPQYAKKLRWVPWSMNPDVIKDWGLKKDIKFLLMGQFHVQDPDYAPKRNPRKGAYPFRESVFQIMKGVDGFVYHPHPGHKARPSENLLVDVKYGKELNRSEIFFTCGGEQKVPVLKFFEAPGCRTLLLAEPNEDLSDLGFKDGVNFVACNESNLYEKAMYYSQNKEERKRITENGYRLIHNHHTNRIRAKQLVQHIKDYLKRK
ncbi:glycosyltransferase family protein [Paenibacillus silviterrae]|uniref:glycosyltransferase family protein n=1 Tax=Paenibacillus silviterrae TaxID=3242194 RepID=UPI0025435842|nr:glycosyltransferase [Paenibacillus chinjuensis]